MLDLHPSILAALTGFVSGLLLSIPVGPVNVTIINEGARRGLLWALMIGFGAVAMEVLYCALAFTGFASLFQGRIISATMEVASFVFMLYLGVKFLTARSIKGVSKVEVRIEEKLHPHSAFMIGFVRVMANPGVFIFWIMLAAYFIRRDWVEPTWSGKMSCVLGVTAGTSLWFSSLSYAVSLGHRKFTEKTLLRMEKISGLCLIALGIAHGIWIVIELSKHK